MNDFLFAVQILTRLPVRSRGEYPGTAGQGRLVLALQA